jgi:hypothetical protein
VMLCVYLQLLHTYIYIYTYVIIIVYIQDGAPQLCLLVYKPHEL